MIGWLIVAVLGVLLLAQGWITRLWLYRISAQLATVTLALRELTDRLEREP